MRRQSRIRPGLIATALICCIGAAGARTWREEAYQRIREIRTRKITLSGFTAGDTVRIRMLRHGFNWGAAIMPWPIGLPEDDPAFPDRFIGQVETYKQKIIESRFTMLGVNAGLKKEWFSENLFLRDRWRASVDSVAAFAARNGMSMRGHVLLWPKTQALPERQKALLSNEASFRARLEADMTDMLLHHRETIHSWDAINEPTLCTDLQQSFGIELLVDALRWAREAVPRNRYLINEHTVITGSGAQTNAFHNRLVEISEAGGVFDGIGFQAHYSFAGNNKPVDSVYGRMEQFASLLPEDGELWITELDTKYHPTDQASADYIRDLITIGFSHPKMKGIIKWGIWENGVGYSNPSSKSAFWDSTWQLKPQGRAWFDLVCGEWWTDTVLVVNSSSRDTSLIGFMGQYECDVIGSGPQERLMFRLADSPISLIREDGRIRIDSFATAVKCPGRRAGPAKEACRHDREIWYDVAGRRVQRALSVRISDEPTGGGILIGTDRRRVVHGLQP